MASPLRPGSLPFLIGLVIAVTLLVLFLLIPGQEKVLERALADRDLTRVAKLYEGTPEAARAKNPELFALLKARVDLDQAIAAAGTQMFDAALTASLAAPFLGLLGDGKYGPGAAEGLAETLALSSSPEQIARTMHEVPGGPAAASRLWQNIARTATQAGNPVAAASALSALSDGSPASTLEIASLWQQANRPGKGIEIIKSWLDRNPGPLEKGDVPLARLYLDLLRQENLNSEALDFLIAHQRTLSAGLPGREFVDAVSRTALASGRSADALPILKAWDQEHPDDADSWLLLANLAMGVGDQASAASALTNYLKLHPDDKNVQLLRAQALEWSGKPGEAFDAYLPLAAGGSRPAVDRLIALAPGLFRESELAGVLPKFLPATGTSPDLLTLARLYVLEGKYDLARDLFRRHLGVHPDDLEVMKSLAEIDWEDQLFEEARSLYARAHKLDPGNIGFEHKLVQLDWIEGRFEGVVERLRALAEKTRSPDIIQEFYSASESQGDISALVDAMELKLSVEPDAPADTYRNLAYYNTMLGRPEAARDAIARGLKRYPESRYFREELAYRLVAAGDPKAALTALEGKVGRDASLDLKSTYAWLLLQAGRQKDALAFLQESLTPKERQSPDILDLTGSLLEEAGRFREAEALYREAIRVLPGNPKFQLALARALGAQGRQREMRAVLAGIDLDKHPGASRDAAQVYLDLEDYRQGAALLRRYLAGPKGADDSLAWRMLGDATLSSGDVERAKRAYRRALQLVNRETKSP